MSATSVQPGRATQAPGDAATTAQVRRARLRAAVAARGIPLATFLVSVAVVVLTYLAGKLAYQLRDVILMILAAGFLALVLNPPVAGPQRRRVRRRVDRRLAGRHLRQLRRGPAVHPGRGRPPGDRPGAMADHRNAGTTRRRGGRPRAPGRGQQTSGTDRVPHDSGRRADEDDGAVHSAADATAARFA
jgi:hypothetical protein